MVTTKAQGLLRLEPDYILTTQRRPSAKSIVKTVPNCCFSIFVTNTPTILQQVDKYMVFGHRNDDICDMTKTVQQTSKDESSPSRVVNTVATDK